MQKKNKKGQIGETLGDLAGTILIFFIIVLFFSSSMLFGLPSLKNEKIKSDINTQVSDYYFVVSRLNLVSSFNYNGENHNVNGADIVKISTLSQEASDMLSSHGLTLEPQLDSFYIPLAKNNLYVSKKVEVK